MRFNKTKNSFISGELSDKLRARTDTDHYSQGVSLMENFTPSTSGGAFKRTGPFIQKENVMSEAANIGLLTAITEDIWLIPFKGKEDYLIMLRNDASISFLAGYYLNYKQVTPQEYWAPVISDLNTADNREKIASALQNRYTGATPAGGILVEGNSNPYWSCQTNDLLVLGSKDGTFPPYTVSNLFVGQPLFSSWGRLYANTNYSIHPKSFFWTPYEPPSTRFDLILTFSALGTGTNGVIDTGLVDGSALSLCTFTLAGGTLSDYFKPGMFVLADGGGAKEGVIFITSISGATASCIILVKLDSLTSKKWRRSKFYYNNYPTCATFYQGRLVLSGLPSDPSTLYFSQTFNHANFMNFRLAQDQTTDVSGLDYFGIFDKSAPFIFEGYATDGAGVQWLIPQEFLRVGTTKGDFEVSYSNEAGELSANNISLERKSGNPCGNIQPAYCDDSIIYINRSNNQVRAIDSKNIGVSYKNTDLSILASNTERSGVTFIPKFVVKVESVADKNIMFIMTQYVPETGADFISEVHSVCMYKHANVAAFHTISFDSNFIIKDICAVALDGADVLAISGTIGGEVVIAYHYPIIDEKPSKNYNGVITSYSNYATYLDWATLREASATNALTTANLGLTGADFYLNKKVSIWYDGKLIHNVTWTGSYTLPKVANVVYIGFPYKAKLITMPIEEGQRFGNSAGQQSRIDTVTAHLYKSSSGKIGFEETNMVSLELDSTKEVTMDKKINFPQSPDIEPRVIIESTEGLPLNVLGITMRGVSYEG